MAGRRGRLPEGYRAGDLVLLGVATFKLSRLISKDRVTAFLRAPFTRFQEDTTAAAVFTVFGLSDLVEMAYAKASEAPSGGAARRDRAAAGPPPGR